MRRVLVVVIALVAATTAWSEEGVFMPWEKFESLYRNSVEREIMKTLPAPRAESMRYSIDEARYTVAIRPGSALVDVLVTGKMLSGKPEPIPLFGKGAVLTDVHQVTGGTIVSSQNFDGVALLPESPTGEFQALLRMLVPVTEDEGVQVATIGVPPALQNSLTIKDLPSNLRLLEAPGIADDNGTYRFAACPSVRVRFADLKRLEAAAVIDLETLTRITLQRGRMFVRTYLLPLRAMPTSITIQTPPELEYLSSSLRNLSIREAADSRYELTPPRDAKGLFYVEWTRTVPDLSDDVSFTLPTVEGNGGQQDQFVVDEFEDGQVTVSGDGLVSHVPVNRLPEPLRQALEGQATFMSIPASNPITLTTMQFKPVTTPMTVLASQYCYTSFEENGNVLSVLVLDLPPELGPRLKLNAIQGAEIWSLKVNETNRKVYGGEEGVWMIPLAKGESSHVELAFLREGQKLGLQGRLEAIVPETGLPSQEVRVGLALPARVELLSIEGPVSPADGKDWEAPTEFVGKHYFFSRSFYQGEGMKLAVSYKEPVDSAHVAKGVTR